MVTKFKEQNLKKENMKKATLKTIFLQIFICFVSLTAFSQPLSIQWQNAFGGNLYDYAKEVIPTSDGGFISVGYSESEDGNVSFNHGGGDCWIIKSSAAGFVQWEKTYGGSNFDYGYSIQQTADGGYIVCGFTQSIDGDITSNHGDGDAWVIKIDAMGSIEWQKTFGGSFNDNAQSVQQTSDGGYIICGYTESLNGDVTGNHGGGDCWVIKTDGLGVIQWTKALGGSSYDFAQDIKQTTDGGYIVCGGSTSNNGDITEQYGNGDYWIAKLDYSGALIWENSFGGTNYEVAQYIELTTDGGYIIAGYSMSNDGEVTGQHGNGDNWIVKCDINGTLQWQKTLGSSGNDYAYCIKQLSTGNYILTGYSEMNDGDVTGNHGNYDCWVVQLDGAGIILQQKSFGGTGVDIGYSIKEASGGTLVIAGYSESNDGDLSGNHGGGDSWIFRMKLSSVGINETPLSPSITVAPTLSTGNFNFSGIENESTLEVFDVAGKLVFQTKINSFSYNLDLSNNAKGVYIYKVNSKSELLGTGKIILN